MMEELSDRTEDSDWLGLDTSVPEENGADSPLGVCEIAEHEEGQMEHREKQEEATVKINGNQTGEIDSRHTTREVKLEVQKDEEERESLTEDSVKEDDAGLIEMKTNEKNQSKEVDKETKVQTNEMQKDATGEKKIQDDEHEVATRSVNELKKPNPNHLNTVEEQHSYEETPSPENPVSFGQHSLSDPEPPGNNRSEETVKEKDRGSRQTLSPPKVQSAVARFQSQGSNQDFLVRSRTKGLVESGKPCNVFWSRGNAQTHPTRDGNIADENNCPEAQEEEDRPPIKVSELKKRFEA